MAVAEIGLFGLTLFLALVALMRWKRRRDLVRQRMTSKLRGYVATENAANSPSPEETRQNQNNDSLTNVA
jgi:hypothetical protein